MTTILTPKVRPPLYDPRRKHVRRKCGLLCGENAVIVIAGVALCQYHEAKLDLFRTKALTEGRPE